MKNYHLNRRLFLRGLGGAAVAAPFLSSIAERAAKAQGMQMAPPKRLIVMFTHYGCLTNRWFPTKSHGELTASDLEETNLAPLAEFAPKILMPRGIRAMNQWHASNNSASSAVGQGNDPHTQVVGSYFTCHPVAPNTDNPFDLQNQEAKFNATPVARSLDHVCAEQLSPDGTPLFMRVKNSQDNAQSAISYSGPGEQFPGIGDPAQVYSSLTNLFQSSEPTPDDYQAVRRQSVIDVVKDDLDTLKSYDMSQADRQKLEAWMELLDSTGKALTQQCNPEAASMLGLADIPSRSGGLGGDPVADMATDSMDWADIFSALATLSALCDANRVIFVKYPGSHTFRGLTTEAGNAIDLDNHGASHRIGDPGMGGDCVGGVMDMLNTIDQFYVRKFANLVGMLDSVPEGDGKLLDNTATVWFQEMSDGNAHNLNNLPIIQAGGCGGYFKTGHIVNVESGAADLSVGNSDKYCNGDNSIPTGDVDGTGTPEGIGTAPINKYFCNLMNAIGVKGNDDGFPDPNGSGPVSKFGMFDDTSLFFGGPYENSDSDGQLREPEIKDPGEFEDLKS